MDEIASSPQDVEEVATDLEQPEIDDFEASPTDEQDGDYQEDADSSEDEEASEPEEVEEFEFNLGGEKFKVPKTAILEEFAAKVQSFTHNLEAGTTRKFQEIAEQKKSMEEKISIADRLQQFSSEAQDKYSMGLHLRSELDQLSGINLDQLWQSEPDKARRISDAISQKEAQLKSIIGDVTKAEREANAAREQLVVKQREEGERLIERQVPGFKEKMLPDVINYAVETLGLDREEAQRDWALNPAMAIAAQKAMLYDRMQASARVKPAPKQPPAKPVKPIQGRGGSEGGDDPSVMTMDEYVAYRRKQGF